MRSATLENRTAPTHEELATRLNALIEALLTCYEAMDRVADERARAVSAADVRALNECVQSESEIVKQVAQLDAERASIVRDMAQDSRFDPATTTISQLAHDLNTPRSEELLTAARRLRALMEQVHHKNAATKLAAEKLARHMQGLLLEAERLHSHSGAYGRSGAVRAGARVVTALDCTT